MSWSAMLARLNTPVDDMYLTNGNTGMIDLAAGGYFIYALASGNATRLGNCYGSRCPAATRQQFGTYTIPR